MLTPFGSIYFLLCTAVVLTHDATQLYRDCLRLAEHISYTKVRDLTDRVCSAAALQSQSCTRCVPLQGASAPVLRQHIRQQFRANAGERNPVKVQTLSFQRQAGAGSET